MDKKSTKFLRVLARKLFKDDQNIKKKTLKKVFRKTVDQLPICPLQQVLKDNFIECYQILKTQIKKNRESSDAFAPSAYDDAQAQDAERKSEDDEEEDMETNLIKISNTQYDFPYNFYLKKKYVNLQRPSNIPQAIQFYLQLMQHHSSQGSIIQQTKDFQHAVTEKTILSALDRLVVLSSGLKDITLIKKILYVYLNKMQPLVEKYLAEENTKKASHLQETLYKALCVSHMRYSSMKCEIRENKPYYKDLIASLLSVYLDLSIFLFRNEEKKKKLLYGFVSIMLTDFPEQKYDVLLQVTQTQSERVELITPLIQYCLQNNLALTDSPSYIKYILSVALINKLDKQVTDCFRDDIKRASFVEPPSGIIDWLEETVPELIDLEDVDHLSSYLVENMTESLHCKLIDSFCDREGIERDESDEEREEEKDEDIFVFNPNISDVDFFQLNNSTGTLKSAVYEDDIENLFVVDRSGNNKTQQKLPEPSITVEDVEEISSDEECEIIIVKETQNDMITKSPTPKLYSPRKAKDFTPVTKQTLKRVAIVSPTRNTKPLPCDEDGSDTAEKLSYPGKISPRTLQCPKQKEVVSSPKKPSPSPDSFENIEGNQTISPKHSPIRIIDKYNIRKSPNKKELENNLPSSVVFDTVSPSKEISSLSEVSIKSPLYKESPNQKSNDEAWSTRQKSSLTKSDSKKSPQKTEMLSPKQKADVRCEESVSLQKNSACINSSDNIDDTLLSPRSRIKKSSICDDSKKSSSRSLKRKLADKTLSPNVSNIVSPKAKTSPLASPNLRNQSPLKFLSFKSFKNSPSKNDAVVQQTQEQSCTEYTIISDSESTSGETIENETWKYKNGVPDMSVHLAAKLKHASASPVPKRSKRCSTGSKSSSDSFTHLKSPPISGQSQRLKAKSKRDVIDADVYAFSSDTELHSPTKTKNLSGQQMKRILEKSMNELAVVKEDEEMAAVSDCYKLTVDHSPMALRSRRRSAPSSHITDIKTPIKLSKKTVSDTEVFMPKTSIHTVIAETKARSRRISRNVLSNIEVSDIVVRSEEVTISTPRKKSMDKSQITEKHSSKTPKKKSPSKPDCSLASSADSSIKLSTQTYSLRNR